MRCAEVQLSSGDRFWVDASLEEVGLALNTRRLSRSFMPSRLVNGSQVAQVLISECPSIITPETLTESEPEPEPELEAA